MSGLILGLLVMGGLGLLLSLILVMAYIKLNVPPNPLEEKLRKILPGANCGGCGFPGCDAYAESLAKGESPPDLCPVGGPSLAQEIAKIIGKEAGEVKKMIAVSTCKGGDNYCSRSFEYRGITTCRAAHVSGGGGKDCVYGCLGYGDCEEACPFNAITMSEYRIPIVDPEKCTGCGICVEVCPRDVMQLIPADKAVYLACRSLEKGVAVKNICKVGCFACGICVRVCPYDALKMEGNIPVMDFDKCTDCGICVAKCPTDSYIDRIPERPKAVIGDRCKGHGECVKVCQFKAIEGEPGQKHRVIPEKCIGCGECEKVCPEKAITMEGGIPLIVPGDKSIAV